MDGTGSTPSLAEPDGSFTAGPGSGVRPKTGRTPADEKRLFRLLAVVAIFALLAAIILNLLTSTWQGHQVADSGQGGSVDRGESITPEKPVLDLLPTSVLSYENTAHQSVPGQGDRAAEAIYATLNMNLAAVIGIVNYARVEATASEGDARARAASLMQSYPVRQQDVQLNGVTIARTGYSQNEGAYAVVWYRDWYVTMLKTSFAPTIPAQKRTFLIDQATPLAEAIDVYQRTGKQGINSPSAAAEGPASAVGDVEGSSGTSAPSTGSE